MPEIDTETVINAITASHDRIYRPFIWGRDRKFCRQSLLGIGITIAR
jgi:hypothetical protein